MAITKTGLIGYFEFTVIKSEPIKLSGLFFNKYSETPHKESAIKKDKLKTIIGFYSTKWFEIKKSEDATLSIEKANKFYTLTWDCGKKNKFIGRGYLKDGLIYGYYYHQNKFK